MSDAERGDLFSGGYGTCILLVDMAYRQKNLQHNIHNKVQAGGARFARPLLHLIQLP